MSQPAVDPRDDEPRWAPIDLLLRQGDAEELARMRRAVADDPLRALDLADTVALVEQLRQLRTEPSPAFAGKLLDVTERAERRLDGAPRGAGRRWWVLITAAAATFALLHWIDPIRRGREASRGPVSFEVRAPAATNADPLVPDGGADDGLAAPEPPRDVHELAWESAIEQVRQRLALESSHHLRDALEAGLQVSDDRLSQWLDPRNVLVLQRLDHELRASAEIRAEALRRRGGLPAADERVQELAEAIAADLAELPLERAHLAEVAWGMRALIGAGSTATRVTALRRSGDWLAERLPELHGEELVLALSGLAELAAISGQHFDAVATHGQRLLEGVLLPDDDTWTRRRPDLLGARVAPSTLGEAGRILARLPAFGADPEHCALVRQLLLGRLRERRERGQDRPEVLAAILYGSADLLAEAQRDRLEANLRRWKPALLAPDFVTVQQLAWGMQPGRRGFARLQGELRQLAVLPMPDGLRERAAFCLCLATSYAGYVGGLLPVAPAPRRS